MQLENCSSFLRVVKPFHHRITETMEFNEFFSSFFDVVHIFSIRRWNIRLLVYKISVSKLFLIINVIKIKSLWILAYVSFHIYFIVLLLFSFF